MNIQHFSQGMETIAGRLLKTPPTSRQIEFLYPKVSRFDADIFDKAVENLSMGDYMPRLKDIYEAYQVAKMQTRRKSDIYGGCRYCEKGKVYYERQNPLSRNKSWVSYIGWCGHCNPPINKNGMFCMLSDCEYPNIRFLTKPSRIDGEQPPKMVKQVVQGVIGKADPEKEKLREKNLAKNQERGQELPF